MNLDSLTNRQDFFSGHYLAEILPATLRKGAWKRWTEAEKDGRSTPRTRLRAARTPYKEARLVLSETVDPVLADKRLTEWHQRLLTHLGVENPAPQTVTMLRGDVEYEVTVAHSEKDLLVIEGGFAKDVDAAFSPEVAKHLLSKAAVDGIETCSDLVSWLLTCDQLPRYILLLHGGVIVLADRYQWGEGKYLAVNLDVALERDDTSLGGELDLIAALFSADMLRTPEGGGENPLSELVTEGRRHAEGVSGELREGLRRSVELIANEVLARLRDAEVDLAQLDDDRTVATQLTRESLRYLYRILFLLYAEARPDLGILPSDYPEYTAGYSLGRLGDLVVADLDGTAEDGFHFYESLAVLTRLVNQGHRHLDAPGVSDGPGIRFEALRSALFEPEAIKLIGQEMTLPSGEVVDTRLRNKTLHAVLRMLMLTTGKSKKQGGFISYAQLGINQLGAVYEGLMSYTGRIATEPLFEVAKNGDDDGGSWLIPQSRADQYDEESFVYRIDPFTGVRHRARYDTGSFVYRLAGRDRQTSASYYTPESLTEVTVQLALKYRLEEAGDEVTADELLRWRVCEPALGSGAFLNEAIDQLAVEYLRRRRIELDLELPPEEYAVELAKVKAYIALHNAYGVDLNETAVELAEVSLWLNVMHPGLKAPWFGLHLRRGNSLIGARRAYYDSKTVRSKDWLKTAPTEHPFRDGDLPEQAIHHFLLPADGWGAVAGEKEAKALAPEQAKQLSSWRSKIKSKPGEKHVKRLQRLAGRAEYLWQLVIKRMEISEREISRHIDVWGAEDLPTESETYTKEHVKEQLQRPGSPFWRLKTLMDTWSALWFWPVQQVDVLDGNSARYAHQPVGKLTAVQQQRRVIPLATLDDWLDYAEALLGTQDLDDDSFAPSFTGLEDLRAHEDELTAWMGMVHWSQLTTRFPWAGQIQQIAEEQGFFHWELHFAQVFAEGGFDLQVGNPPWVRPDWNEKLVLAEREPWFALAEKPSTADWKQRKAMVLENTANREFYLSELAANTGVATFTSESVTYPLLDGTRPDLYRCFMIRAWANLGPAGTAGLIHPGTHFSGKREGKLRAAAYRHLRLHGHFENELSLFDIGGTREFAVQIYGKANDVEFVHLSYLYAPACLIQSLTHNGDGALPGIKYRGSWDVRPHRDRLNLVTEDVLAEWRRLSGDSGTSVEETKLLYPVTTAENAAIASLANAESRLGDLQPRISGGYNEKTAKDSGLIKWATRQPDDWSQVILQGPHFGIATPLAKQPNIPCRSKADYQSISYVDLVSNAVPRTNYVRADPSKRFIEARDRWVDHDRLAALLKDPLEVSIARNAVADAEKIPPVQVTDEMVEKYLAEKSKRPYTDFYRVAWRRMIPQSTERSLFAALIPPGPSHVDAVLSMSCSEPSSTAYVAGVLAALPVDYLLRVTGANDLRNTVRDLPVPLTIWGRNLLILRTLRLNCLTDAYSPLWAELYESAWQSETWARDWDDIQPLGTVTPEWEWATPLRTEYERRAALVEIDALVAVMLGMSADELAAIYTSRYAVLNSYESQMWFDASGRKIAKEFHAQGVDQPKTAFAELELHLAGRADPPEGYTAPFYKADREREMREAHAEFTRRMEAAS